MPPKRRAVSPERPADDPPNPKAGKMRAAQKRETAQALEESLEQDKRDGLVLQQLTQPANKQCVEQVNFLKLCQSKTITQGWHHADCSCSEAVVATAVVAKL